MTGPIRVRSIQRTYTWNSETYHDTVEGGRGGRKKKERRGSSESGKGRRGGRKKNGEGRRKGKVLKNVCDNCMWAVACDRLQATVGATSSIEGRRVRS